MKIALISIEPDIKAFGLRTLSSCLKQEGHNVKLIFLPNHFTNKYKEETLYELVELVRNSNVIGISLMTNFYDNAIQITKKLKHDLNTLVMWGGIHPTVRPDECISHADIVCLGEAEESFIELAHKLENGRDFLDTDGFWFKHGNKTVKNQIRKTPKDINKIPFQDYNYEYHYILVNGNNRKMDLGLLEDYCGKHYKKGVKKHYLNMLFSLLHNYKSKGSSISTKSMALLTNTFIRKYKLHWILYFVYNLPCKTAYLKNLMKSAVRDIRNNNYDRIIGFIQRRIFRKA